MKNQIVIGLGEVGRAVYKVLTTHYKNIFSLDENKPRDAKDFNFVDIPANAKFDVVHICFPYSKRFVNMVKFYQAIACANLVVIHSSVPIGTTARLGSCAVHSPVIGNHPHLFEGIKTFVKYFGGNYKPTAKRAKELFAKCGVKGQICLPEESEALKLLLNVGYGLGIIFEKEVFEFCKTRHINFKTVHDLAIQNYNTGYARLNMGHAQRPIYAHKDGPIGGHCVIQNCELIKDNFPNVAKFIIGTNRKFIKTFAKKRARKQSRT